MRRRKERGAEKVISSGAIKGQLARDLQRGSGRECVEVESATAIIPFWTRETRDGGSGGGLTTSTTDGWGNARGAQ